MSSQLSPTKKTFVTVFQLAEILLADRKDEEICETTIRESINIAQSGLSQSRRSHVQVDVERMISKFLELYN